MLCHAHIRQLIRSVSAGTTRCCLVFDGSSRKDKEQLYSTCDVSSNSFLNGSYLILLLIFLLKRLNIYNYNIMGQTNIILQILVQTQKL